jgi:ubiquinone/menaquinone biosynthesis C-methylase UbiE
MKRHIQQWQRLGASDPYWAVLTDPSKRHGRWTRAEFFATGEAEIQALLERLEQLQLVPTMGKALDFGCGVGRLSRALAKRFRKVAAVDISESMLAEAKAANSALFPNIDFVHNTVPDLQIFTSETFDFIYSNIVLQHIARPYQEAFLREFCRLLTPGGIMVFQTPAKPNLKDWQGCILSVVPQPLLNIGRSLIHGRDGVMEMHWVPSSAIEELLKERRVRLESKERYDSAGKALIGYRYYAQKTTASAI